MNTRALLAALVACLSLTAPAATVGPAGYSNDFSVQPPAADWATLSIAGAAQDSYDMDTNVNFAITAPAVVTQTTPTNGTPPTPPGNAVWNSTAFYLQIRPTQNKYTVLMATFVNDSGTNATQINLSYLFTIAGPANAEEGGKGNRVYYSLTGANDSWVNLPALNNAAAAPQSLTLSTNVDLNWPSGSTLYVLWADDNANPGTDMGDQIDDFALRITAGTPLSTALTARLTAPTNNALFVSGTAIAATSLVSLGTGPYSVKYFLSSGAGFNEVGTSTTPPFNVNLGALAAGTYNIYAAATDSAVPATTTNTVTNTFFVADPITITLTSPPDGAGVDNTTAVTGRATISGGTPPYSLQFFLDGAANGSAITSEPFERNFGALFVGDHSIRATVTDSKGWVSNSLTHIVHISGPLGVTLTPANGASFNYGQSITLTAAPGGGTAPYHLIFFVNGAGTNSSGNTLNLGILPPGTYNSYVHAVDSASQQADSTLNTFTVAPNPIVVNLTAPTSGQTGFPGSTLAVAATASVNLPLIITNVAFYYDGVLAGNDASAPYSNAVANVTQGNHTIYAVATDSLGRQSVSQTNQVSISAPPGSNDQFANAIPLFGPVVSTTGNNSTATKQFGPGGEPTFVGGSLGGASLWWTWTASASGPTTIDTQGSDFDTILGIFVGNAQNQLALVGDNNDSEGNTWSRVQFNAVAGTIYRIVVDGNGPLRFPPSPARGNIRLNIKGVGGVEITSPAIGTVFTFGDPVPVAVRITPDFPNPPAARVDFYIGATLFASSTTPPFNAVATNVPAGSNTLSAIAVDSTGAAIQSPIVPIFVQKIGVTILTPFEDTLFQTTTNPITVTAWSYLPSGTMTNIEFFVDNVKIGEDANAPYAATWTNVTPGSHRITAVGRSDTGVAYNSQPVNIGVVSVIVPFASVWKYLDDGSDQGTAWIAPNFDDSTWLSGPAPLGYSDSNGRLPATTNSFGPNPNAKYTNTYYRMSLTATNVSSFSQIILGIERDDGAIVYLNGVEIGRFNMPTGLVTSTTPAAANANDDGGTLFTLNLSPSMFVNGLNTFAVEIHQDNTGNSSDIWFQLRVTGIPFIIHNISPLVSITNPTSGQYFLAPSSVTLEAEASDPDGSVAKVKFFVDGLEVGEAANAPYSVVWNAPSVAAHTLTAVATDDLGGTATSAEVPIVIYDAVGTPVAAITSPADGAIMPGPTNLLVTATANAIAGVANVQFYANGVEFGSDATAPYAAMWDAPFGTNLLTAVVSDVNGVRGTSPVATVTITIPPTNVIAPAIFTQLPLEDSTVTSLSNITVTFSENVQNIDASDLLINGVPATTVNAHHSRSNYTFTFAQPPYGQVNITWAGGHGITDYGWPTLLPFDETAPGASWTYTLIDQNPPTIVARTPAPSSTVTNLQEITVTFSEPVTGVDASDLLVNGGSAFGMSGSGTTYTFLISQPPAGTVNVTWSTNNNIVDQAVVPNAFNRNGAGAAWSFTLDNRVVLVQSNSVWRFVKGTYEASYPTNAWRQPDFDDSDWTNSPAPFFFGDPYTNATIRGTLLSDMLSNYTTIYLRQEFTVLNRGNITGLLLNAQSDDGFVAWINGVEVRRYNVPGGELPYNAVASSAAPEPGNNGAGYIVASLPAAAVAALVDGRNVLTVQALNQSLTNSTDFGFNAQLYTFPIEPGTVAPRLLAPSPAPGDVLYLTNITVTFSEPVSGVDEEDLLINGNPASTVSSSTNTTYTFGFTQPPYGPVSITWNPSHNIVDFDGPPKPFDGAATGSTFNYTLINPSNPRILTQAPLAGTTITGLTAVVVTFTEPVSGVDAADFLINGRPATSVGSDDATSYTFNFTQPPFGSVAIRWASNHAIVDVEGGHAFDPTRFGGQWNYTLVDPAPSVTITSPTNGAYRLEPANVTVTATATDNDGTIATVAFYSGSSLLGQVTNTPYSIALSNLALGTYVFRAIATDNMGLTGTSAPVVLNVVTSLPASLVRGPYLQIGTATGGVVRWRSDVFTDALVYYGTDPENLTNYASETSVTNEHIVKINGLQPSTRYYYSIGSASQRLVGTNGVGSDYWFDTSPVPGTRKHTRFWVLGDPGTAGNGAADRQQSTRNAFYNYAATNGQPDIWLLLGDNAYNSGLDNEYQRAIFDLYPTTLRNKFVWPAIGNHETAQSFTATDFPYLHIFSLPKDGEAGGVASGTEKYYSFDYANIHFICLDSMTSGRTSTSPMAEWLKADLAGASAEWVVVFFHHPPYTKGNHDSDREQELIDIRANILPILETNGVDMVLCGHSHAWERSYLLHGHYGLSSTLTPSMKVDGGDGRVDGTGAYRKNDQGFGVVYTVTGSAGQATGGSLNHAANFLSLNEIGTMVIDINENRMDAIFLRESGEIQDHFTILKPDLRPAAPLNLVALPTAPTQVNLSWTDVATNESGYIIERSTDGANFAQVLAVDATATSALDSGLLNNVTYYYRVRSTNFAGASLPSNIASINTVTATAPPRAPANLVATAYNDEEFFRSQMVLRWADLSDNEAAFVLERSVDALQFAPVATMAANLRSYIDHGLDSATVYFYRVRAVNSVGESAPSAIATDQTHPQSQLVQAGRTVTFHGGTEGAPAVRYQWRFNDDDLLGETNETLVITNVWINHNGEYSVLLRDSNGSSLTKNAILTVAAIPRITSEPQGGVFEEGVPFQLGVSAEGSLPLTYAWRKNAAPLGTPGSDGPALSFDMVHVSDQGNYDVIVGNAYGSATSRVARLVVAADPTLDQVANLTAEVLHPLIIKNRATDPNVPPLNLVFSLGPGAPTNALLNPQTGFFAWTPNRSQAPGTNDITINVADQSNASLQSSMTFNVRVNHYVEIALGSLTMLGNTNGTIPVTLFSSVPLTQAQFDITFPGENFTDITFQRGGLASTSVIYERTSIGSASFTFTSGASGGIIGMNQIGTLRLSTGPAPMSIMARIHVASLNITPIDPTARPTLVGSDGRAIVIGTRPMLDAHFTSQGRELTIFGLPGSYQLEYVTNLTQTTWTRRAITTIPTNYFRLVPLGNNPPTNVSGFFRLRQ